MVKLMLEKHGMDIESTDKYGATAILLAAKIGSETTIRFLVQKRADVTARSNQGYHILYFLILKEVKSVSLFNLLIDKGASAEAVDGDGFPTIVRAAEYGLTSIVRLLVRNGVDLESGNYFQQTALAYAAGKGHIECLRALLELGAEVEPRDKFGFTPFLRAVHCGHQACISILLDNGADVNAVSLEGCNAVELALSNQQKAMASFLIGTGYFEQAMSIHTAVTSGTSSQVALVLDTQPSLLNDKDSERQLPIHRAARAGKDDAVSVLLQRGADVESADDQGNTALMYAACYNQKQAARILLQNGAKIRAVNKQGWAPIHFATSFCDQPTMAEVLLEEGASIEEKTSVGDTPLHRACFNGKVEVVKYLISRGAEIDSHCDGEITPMLKAVRWQHFSTVEVMIEAGCDLRTKSKDAGLTPLLCAATWTNNTALVDLLLRRGASIEEQDNQGVSVVGRAALNAKDAVFRFLLEKGADVNARDRWGQTPLQRAVRGQLESSVHMLLDTDAEIVAKDDVYGMSTIHYVAVWNTTATIAGLLLDKGSSLEDRDVNGCTPLFLSATRNRPAVLQLLLKRGADIKAKDKDGFTSLMRVVMDQSEVGVRILLECGADVSAREERMGRNPFAYSCSLKQ